jgi:hypothetical protein
VRTFGIFGASIPRSTSVGMKKKEREGRTVVHVHRDNDVWGGWLLKLRTIRTNNDERAQRLTISVLGDTCLGQGWNAWPPSQSSHLEGTEASRNSAISSSESTNSLDKRARLPVDYNE